jgi:hypothetical protein
MQPQHLSGDGVQLPSGVVDAFPEQAEAGMPVDPLGSLRTYVVLELKEARNGVMVPAPEKEGQGAEEPGLLLLFPILYIYWSSDWRAFCLPPAYSMVC